VVAIVLYTSKILPQQSSHISRTNSIKTDLFQNPKETVAIVACFSHFSIYHVIITDHKKLKYATGVASNDITLVLNLKKIGHLVQILIRRPAHR